MDDKQLAEIERWFNMERDDTHQHGQALLAEVKRLREESEGHRRAVKAHQAGEDVLQANINALVAEKEALDAYRDEVSRLTADRDRAREIAVALEQEVARQAEQLGQARLDEQYDAMATAGAFDEEEPF